jgi:hypothetical protein
MAQRTSGVRLVLIADDQSLYGPFGCFHINASILAWTLRPLVRDRDHRFGECCHYAVRKLFLAGNGNDCLDRRMADHLDCLSSPGGYVALYTVFIAHLEDFRDIALAAVGTLINIMDNVAAARGYLQAVRDQ